MNYTIQADTDEFFVLKNDKQVPTETTGVTTIELPVEAVEDVPVASPQPAYAAPRAAPLENYRTTVPGEWFGGTSWSTK